ERGGYVPNKLAVIGSGVMGRGIAYVSAISGFDVKLIDIKKKQLADAKQELETIFDKGIERNKIMEDDKKTAKARMVFETDLVKAVAYRDLVIEAVTEKLDIKKSVFETIDEHAPNGCTFATNTSTMSPTEIGSYTNNPERVIGMHFFNPVHKMPLVKSS